MTPGRERGHEIAFGHFERFDHQAKVVHRVRYGGLGRFGRMSAALDTRQQCDQLAADAIVNIPRDAFALYSQHTLLFKVSESCVVALNLERCFLDATVEVSGDRLQFDLIACKVIHEQRS